MILRPPGLLSEKPPLQGVSLSGGSMSLSAISDEVGITKGALYRHYKSKRDIFDHIVARMFEVDAERARQYEVPD